MAVDATRIKLETLRDVLRCHISRFEIPSTPAMTISTLYRLNTGVREGTLTLCRVASVSGVDYTASFRVHEFADEFTVDEILRIENITDRGYQEANLGIVYSNEEERLAADMIEKTNLFLQITNHDSVANTGIVTVELSIESAD
jgi:hypothetical protein